jgi:hypothetical protein
MKSDNNGTLEVLHLDLSDPTYATLAKAAGRVATILRASKGNKDLVGSLDDFLGAIYALVLAKHGNFEDRSNREIEVGVVLKRANQIASGEVRTSGPWIAGFHFNSALFRIDSVYHRILKIVVGVVEEKNEVGALASKARKFYRKKGIGWTNESLDRIHDQTNNLKHSSKGTYDGRIVSYEGAISAVEELLKLLEAWCKHGGLAPKGVGGISKQFPERLGSQSSAPDDHRHGIRVDRIVPRNGNDALAIRHHNMFPLASNPESHPLQRTDGAQVGDAGDAHRV